MDRAPQNTVDFGQLISERFSQLTKSEKRIANYLRKNQEESAFLSAGELADRLGLSEATMVRFARTLGFNSYPAMRSLLQDNFRQRVTHSARLRSRLDGLHEAGDILDRVVASEIDYLTQALETTDRQSLHRAVDLLKASERIFVFGLGPSISLVDLIELRLGRFGRQVIPLTTSGREIIEKLVLLKDKDLLIAICFFDVSAVLQLVLDYAQEVHCPVIMLTDTLGSIIGDKADVVLSARRGPVSAFHSLVVPMTIINALLLALAQEEQEQALTDLDKLDELRERFKNANKLFSS